jgi:hypothetical protein
MSHRYQFTLGCLLTAFLGSHLLEVARFSIQRDHPVAGTVLVVGSGGLAVTLVLRHKTALVQAIRAARDVAVELVRRRRARHNKGRKPRQPTGSPPIAPVRRPPTTPPSPTERGNTPERAA